MKKHTILLVIAIGFGLAACNEKPANKPGYSDAESSSEKIEAAKAKGKLETEAKTKAEADQKIQAGIAAALKKRDEDALAQKPGAPTPVAPVTPVVPEPDLSKPDSKPNAKPSLPNAPKVEEKPVVEEKPKVDVKPEIKPNTPVAPVPDVDDEDAPVVETGDTEEAPVVEKSEPKKEDVKEEAKSVVLVNPKAEIVAIKLGAGNEASAVLVDCADKIPGAELLNKGIVLLPGSRAILATANEKNEDVAQEASCASDKTSDLKKDLAKTRHEILGIGTTKKVSALMQTQKDGKSVAVAMDVEVTCAKDEATASTLRGITLLAGSSISLDEKGEKSSTLILGCQ